MRDGRVVAERPAAEFTRDCLVAAMGSVARGAEPAAARSRAARLPSRRSRSALAGRPTGRSSSPIAARSSASPGSPARARPRCCSGSSRAARRGTASEVAARSPWSPATGRPTASSRSGRSPATSPIGSLRALDPARPDRSRRRGAAWRETGASASASAPPTWQQHPVAFGRQPAEGAVRPRARLERRDRPDGRSDARRRRRHQAGGLRHDRAPRPTRGRTFVWYTTEMDELDHCDHVYVFRNGRIVADLPRATLTEERVLQSSFAGAAA